MTMTTPQIAVAGAAQPRAARRAARDRGNKEAGSRARKFNKS